MQKTEMNNINYIYNEYDRYDRFVVNKKNGQPLASIRDMECELY